MMMLIPQTMEAVEGARFELRQPWQGVPDAEFCGGMVRVSWNADGLIVSAELQDDEVVTRATDDNQKMWELGDTFEVFLRIEGRSDYVELHVTPNSKRMHLHLPGVGGRASADVKPTPFEKMLVWPVRFDGKSTRTSAGWRVEMFVPASVLGRERLEVGLGLRVSFCRYDAGLDRRPVLSTTSRHPMISFHRPDEWTAVTLSD